MVGCSLYRRRQQHSACPPFSQGGVRVNAFVSGGYLPEPVRGTKQEGIVHVADWLVVGGRETAKRWSRFIEGKRQNDNRRAKKRSKRDQKELKRRTSELTEQIRANENKKANVIRGKTTKRLKENKTITSPVLTTHLPPQGTAPSPSWRALIRRTLAPPSTTCHPLTRSTYGRLFLARTQHHPAVTFFSPATL